MIDVTRQDRLTLRIDPDHSCVWIDSQRVVLRPTPFVILQYLAEHAGQLVSKDDMLRTVWPDTHVSSTVLKAYIQQLRKALGDDAKMPRFIETVQRRGYRFIGTVVIETVVSSQ